MIQAPWPSSVRPPVPLRGPSAAPVRRGRGSQPGLRGIHPRDAEGAPLCGVFFIFFRRKFPQ